MKAIKLDAHFYPISLVLESQEEVDAVYSLINHATLWQAVGLPDTAYKCLYAYKSDGARALHTALCKVTR